MHGQHNIILRCTVSTTLYWDARSAQHQNLQFATQMFCRRPPLTTSDSIIEGVGEYNNHYSYFQIPWQRYRILSSVIRRACSPKGRATNFSVQALPSSPPPCPVREVCGGHICTIVYELDRLWRFKSSAMLRRAHWQIPTFRRIVVPQSSGPSTHFCFNGGHPVVPIQHRELTFPLPIQLRNHLILFFIQT